MNKISIGRLNSLIGVLVLSMGLICNAFEIVSSAAFRIIVLVGIITEVVALIFTIKKSEF